jgi:HK97 family phage major capsid protein
MFTAAHLAAIVVATSIIALLTLLTVAARHGGGASAVQLVGRALGLRPRLILSIVRFARFEVPFPGWPMVAGGAVQINELRQSLIEAKATLQNKKGAHDSLLDQQAAAKIAYHGLLKKQADGKLTEQETKDLPGAEAAFQGFEARISAQRKLVAAAESEVAKLEQELNTAEQARDKELADLKERPSGRVSVDPPNATKDPKRGFADHKDFLGAVMRFGITGGRLFDERLKPLAAVKQAGIAGVDGRKAPFAAAGSDEQGVYSDPHGGFLVPVGVAPGILSVAPEDDPLAGLLTPVPMMSPTVSFNARVDKNHATSVSGGLTVTRRPETVDGASSRMQFDQVVLTANEEFGLAFASERIIADSPQSFVAILQAGFRDEYVASAMKERINGTGTGERLGVLLSPAKIKVAKEGGQPADTIKKENIDKMAARCWRYSRAVWLANHNTRPQLKSLVQVIGTGGNAVPYFTNEGGRELLDGRPIFFSEFAKTIGDEGDLILIVPSEYLEGTYESEQYAESIHVRFTAGERAFRFYRRNDGRPWWTSPLIPNQGDTLSPIVTLADRA